MTTLIAFTTADGQPCIERVSNELASHLISLEVATPAVKPEEFERYLGQIWKDDHWVDYARGSETYATKWQAEAPSKRRVIDAISGEPIIKSVCPTKPINPAKPEGRKQMLHVDPHEETTYGGVVFTCGACDIRIAD